MLAGITSPNVNASDMPNPRGQSSAGRPEGARAAADRIMKIEQVLGELDLSGRSITSMTKKVCISYEEDIVF